MKAKVLIQKKKKNDESQTKDTASDRENKEDVDTEVSEDKAQVASMSMAKVADSAEPLAISDEAASEPNYSIDEKEIKDYSGSERYKETDLQPGSTIVENLNTDEGKVKDGFKFDTLNP